MANEKPVVLQQDPKPVKSFAPRSESIVSNQYTHSSTPSVFRPNLRHPFYFIKHSSGAPIPLLSQTISRSYRIDDLATSLFK